MEYDLRGRENDLVVNNMVARDLSLVLTFAYVMVYCI